MKKIFCAVDITLILSILISVIFQTIFAQAWLSTLTIILFVALAVLNLLYLLNFRNKKTIIPAGLIVLGILFAIIASAYVVKNPTTFFIMLALSQCAFMGALLLNIKFSVWDILFMVAITIPMLLFVNLSPIFGYSGAFNRVLVSLFVTLISCVFGLTISHLIKEKTAFNIMFSFTSLFNLIYGLVIVALKQTTVTHRINVIIDFAFYVWVLLFVVSILFIKWNAEKVESKHKRNIACSVCVCLVALLLNYTLVSNVMAYNLLSAKIYKDQFLSMVGNNLNIPIVEVNTQNNEHPRSKEEYVNCSFKISNCDNEEYNFSVPMTENYEDEGCVGIRLRGNSTRRARKQPYRIKFDEKQSLFGLKANKSWVLLADYFDQSYIRNYTAFTLADSFDNLDFTATPHHVALVINNEFKGLYLLCEQMDEKKGRANVDEDFDISVDTEFPFFVEMDILAYKEGATGIDNFYVESVDNHVEIKYPEADERYATKSSDIVYDYIYEYINAVFTALKTNEKVEVSFRDTPVGFEDLVDVDSAVDYYLINEIMINTDNPCKSIYFHKTKDGKMEFGPIWDFDFSMTTDWVAPYDKSYIEDANTLWIAKKSKIFNELFKNESFYNKVAQRYNDKKDAILSTCDYLKDYKSVIDLVAKIDAKMWHGTTGEFQFDMQYDYVRLFMLDRYSYLNNIFAKSHTEFLELIQINAVN